MENLGPDEAVYFTLKATIVYIRQSMSANVSSDWRKVCIGQRVERLEESGLGGRPLHPQGHRRLHQAVHVGQRVERLEKSGLGGRVSDPCDVKTGLEPRSLA